MGEIRTAYKIVVRNPEGMIQLGDLRIDGRIILK
jgi:hypothetical protein